MKSKICCPKNLSLTITVLALCAIFAGSCDLPGGPDLGKGSLTLLLPRTTAQGTFDQKTAGPSLAVISDSAISGLTYRVTLTGPGETQTLEAGGGGTTVYLEAGTWTIEAAAYDPGVPGVIVGKGNITITVAAGQNSSVRIPMQVNPAYEVLLTEIFIHNEAELRRVGADFAIDGSIDFYLERDIVLTQPWTPIGDDTTPFEAVFNGQGHTVTMSGGFATASLTGFDLGFFGNTDGAEIKNLGVIWNIGSIGSPVGLPMYSGAPTQNIGGLAGRLLDSQVTNVSVKGSLCFSQTGTTDGLSLGGIAGVIETGSEITLCSVSNMTLYGNADTVAAVGGVAGSSYDGSISKSSFSGTAQSGKGWAGGIAGGIDGGSISECHAAGTIRGVEYAGGIAGTIDASSIENCYAYARVITSSTSQEAAGGIAGRVDGGPTIDKCYAAGSVESQGTDPSTVIGVGGIAGDEYGGGSVANSVSLASLLDGGPSTSPSKKVHAIMGNASSTTLSGNYSRNDITPTRSTDGTDSGLNAKDGEGKPLNDFKSSTLYATAGWNFANDWKFLSGSGYPFPVLFWQTSPPDLSYVPSGLQP
jgi:hypothetical protein